MPNKVNMFSNARNVNIRDSSFTVIADSSKERTLDRLLDEVSHNAILNGGGRADEVRCYPGTREEVIGKIEGWMDGQGEAGHRRMLWLGGPAGAGKSAISQTVAERCAEDGTRAAAANFFFFRGDGTRNHAQPLVATLAYQLRGFHHSFTELLTDCLTVIPLICKASIEEQFKNLLSYPVQKVLHSSPTHLPLILIIDGLDECDDKRKQEQIIVSLHALVDSENSPFRVLIASRAEHHLEMAFNRLGNAVFSIFLDDQYRPQDDIRRFVIAKFDEIKAVHSFAHTLDKHWPTESDINAIVDKSSGQFIYAATVMRFIEYSPESPTISLHRVNGIRPPAGHSPLAQLDAIYSYIFSTAHDISAVKLILGAHFIMQQKNSTRLQHLLQLRGYEAVEVKSLLADLVAIVQFAAAPLIQLVFYHASLSDYLMDKSRSGIYHIDLGQIATELSTVCLRNLVNPYSLTLNIWVLEYVPEANTDLSESLLIASTRQFNEHFGTDYVCNDMIRIIKKLYLMEDKVMFKLLLKSWVRFAYLHHINIGWDLDLGGTYANWQFRWYWATEGAKFRFGRQKPQSRTKLSTTQGRLLTVTTWGPTSVAAPACSLTNP